MKGNYLKHERKFFLLLSAVSLRSALVNKVNVVGKHPSGSTAILYMPREKGGRGLRSIEEEYKVRKIKAAVKLYRNGDPAMRERKS